MGLDSCDGSTSELLLLLIIVLFVVVIDVDVRLGCFNIWSSSFSFLELSDKDFVLFIVFTLLELLLLLLLLFVLLLVLLTDSFACLLLAVSY
jgi:hypothetical protein